MMDVLTFGIGSDKANDPTHLFPLSNDKTSDNNDDDNGDTKKRLNNTAQPSVSTKNNINNDDDSDSDHAFDVPQTLFAFHHRHSILKPNWMTHSGSHDTSFSHSLFVADTSNAITVYNNIPITR